MNPRLIVGPTEEPVTLEEVKAQLRIDGGDTDEMVARLIASAREWVERRVQTKLVTQTWEFALSGFPCSSVTLPFGPVQSVTSIVYDDDEGTQQTVDVASYRLSDPYVVLIGSRPSTATGNSVRVRFVAGLEDLDLVSETIKSAIILKVKELYDGEDTSAAVDRLLVNHLQMVA